jgi:N-acetylneuraminic acid mutarotase
LLPNGLVLIAGGYVGTPIVLTPTSSTELFDPATGQPAPGPYMLASLVNQSAILLNNGKVLVIGGLQYAPAGTTAAEIYDPTSNTWSAAAGGATKVCVGSGAIQSCFSPSGTPVLLQNGSVLVFNGGPPILYDPTTDAWSVAGSYPNANGGGSGTATLLPNGNVLAVGGSPQIGPIADAEIYNPTSNTWSTVAPYPTPVSGHTATVLNSGMVLVAGGVTTTSAPTSAAASALYDPTTNTWTAAGSLSTPRYGHLAQFLPDGTVLVEGGFSSTAPAGTNPTLVSAERYDPATNAWSSAGNMANPRYLFAATALNDGRVPEAGCKLICQALTTAT